MLLALPPPCFGLFYCRRIPFGPTPVARGGLRDERRLRGEKSLRPTPRLAAEEGRSDEPPAVPRRSCGNVLLLPGHTRETADLTRS